MPLLPSLAVVLQLAAAVPVGVTLHPAPTLAPTLAPAALAALADTTRVPADTPRVAPRPRAVEYSDWYTRRATIHKVGSFAMLPLFAAQWYTGNQLIEHGSDASAFARRAHGPIATGVAGLFALNTVTGVWNLWEGRHDPAGRGWRVAHALLMLGADAGFVAAGAMADDAEQSGDARNRHRTVALTSMGVAVAGWTMMLPPFRRE